MSLEKPKKLCGGKGHQGLREGGWEGPGFADAGRGAERARPARQPGRCGDSVEACWAEVESS